jgi:hypothetical protein
MEQEQLSADKLAAIYRRIRAAIDAKEEEHKREIEALRDELEVVSQSLLEICNAQNADSLRTAEGTIMRRVKTRFWTTDWESMYKFIKEHDAPYLLQQRIHEGNMKQFLDENPEAFPVGMQVDNKYAITVRKPTSK